MQDKLAAFFTSMVMPDLPPICALQTVTRHLTPALSPNSVGGEGESSAVSLKNLRLDLPDNHPQNQNRPAAISSPGGEDLR
jgi:hypothetical protein